MMKIQISRFCTRMLSTMTLLMLGGMAYTSPAAASTVARLAFDDVVADAELIFEGRVLATESRQTGPGSIHTFVEFQVLAVIKGDYTAATLTLRYLGGRAGNRVVQVTDMQIPAEGETGFYFVESLSQNLMHPLVGWAQGHYLIRQDNNGQWLVYTAGEQSIDAVAPPGATGRTIRRTQTLGISHGTADGIQVQAPGAAQAGMTADSFRGAVQDRVPGRGRLIP